MANDNGDTGKWMLSMDAGTELGVHLSALAKHLPGKGIETAV